MLSYPVLSYRFGQVSNPKMSSLAYHCASGASWRRLFPVWGAVRQISPKSSPLLFAGSSLSGCSTKPPPTATLLHIDLNTLWRRVGWWWDTRFGGGRLWGHTYPPIFTEQLGTHDFFRFFFSIGSRITITRGRPDRSLTKVRNFGQDLRTATAR